MGDYSDDIPREIAKKIVAAHPAFKNPKNRFWFNYDDRDYLHYGIHSLEGEIKLNAEGKKYFKKLWKEAHGWPF